MDSAKSKDSDLQWEQVHDCEENKGKGEKKSSDPILYDTTMKKTFYSEVIQRGQKLSRG
ncbi:MAG: hypothetical protein ACM37W_09065 [Actinomycetota bacterium]